MYPISSSTYFLCSTNTVIFSLSHLLLFKAMESAFHHLSHSDSPLNFSLSACAINSKFTYNVDVTCSMIAA